VRAGKSRKSGAPGRANWRGGTSEENLRPVAFAPERKTEIANGKGSAGELARGSNPGARAAGDETGKRENLGARHEDQVGALCSTGQEKSRRGNITSTQIRLHTAKTARGEQSSCTAHGRRQRAERN
jgi:hypothetical protein